MPFGFTGEQADATELVYLRARYLSPAFGIFLSLDPFEGMAGRPMSLNGYMYVEGDPVNMVDPGGQQTGAPELYVFEGVVNSFGLTCDPDGQFLDCEGAARIIWLRHAFLDSASRHNNIPGMSNLEFAAAVATAIAGERRINRVNAYSSFARLENAYEDIAASLCVVSGDALLEAIKLRDLGRFYRYLTNQEIPPGNPIYAYASVGIGNIKLPTAAQLWRGEVCSFFGDCTSVNIGPIGGTNLLGLPSIPNPFEPELVCSGFGGFCAEQPLSEVQSYQELALQLLNEGINIEYASAIIEGGAERAKRLGIVPNVSNSLLWYTRSVHTEAEIEQLVEEITVFPTRDHVVGHSENLAQSLYPEILHIPTSTL